MTNKTSSLGKLKASYDFGITLGLVAVLIFFILSGAVSYANTRSLLDTNQLVTHTHEVLTGLENVVSIMKDAETGQRGYLLTGNDRYLDPYNQALNSIDEQMAKIDQMVKDNQTQELLLKPLRSHINAKFAELGDTINLRRTKGFAAALALVITDRGKVEMDLIRSKINEMQREEQRIRDLRIAESETAYRTAILSGLLTCGLGALLSLAVAALMRRSATQRRQQEWLQAGELGLSSAIFGDQRVDELGDNILKFLAKYFDAHAGAFFALDGDSYRRMATYGISTDDKTPQRFTHHDGLLGQAVRESRTFVMNDVPENYLTISSALGQGKPRHLVISPSISDGTVNAVIELGFVHPLDELAMQLLTRVSETISVAVKSANYRANLQNFLEETQRQAEELQAQSEELRVSNEELEEQSRTLKESQSRLEQQQSELEQTNSQLEEQTQQLEIQRDDLTKTKEEVETKAHELEMASKYKSDFLANMSHELRTPLNSSLILAKLLADNPTDNLSEEQIKYAQTIQSSNNDLLLLINDILDLSKIEAGHMDIKPEPLPVAQLLKDLNRVFQPIAKDKGLVFNSSIGPNCPKIIETDRQRLEQILRNLLSNAFKFTEKGTVDLTLSCLGNGRISFAVKDTGIGISLENQETVFDAFRQADGTISRKYGGTGLGLSISRELARLLGGSIELTSIPGQGSTFTLALLQTYDASQVSGSVRTYTQSTDTGSIKETITTAAQKAPERRHWIEDDRDRLTAKARLLLVVEDDESFARILYDMAHELDFQCLITDTAEDALTMAKQYMPSAVILDVGLPDHSGLSVLDRIKHDVRTRHIPVHVISGGDYIEKALSLGAVGYMLKPVKRDDLVNAIKKLETKLSQPLRRVLIVEDDAVQRDSLKKLLGSVSVKTEGAGTAAECLALLKKETFDCMVLDLSLPDASGYSLLETLNQEDDYSFPPVIVYTGRDLSAKEEQQLRRYSKSIIIKGAKSPERLLDEVTLFLHQVVSDLPAAQQKMLEKAKNRDAALEGRRILIVEDDIRNVYALSNILEPRGAFVEIARNGREALEALEKGIKIGKAIDLVLMDVMMPEVDGLTATRQIRLHPEWRKLPVIMLTAKAMRDDQERCLEAGANDYMAKPLDVEKLLSLVRVWMPR